MRATIRPFAREGLCMSAGYRRRGARGNGPLLLAGAAFLLVLAGIVLAIVLQQGDTEKRDYEEVLLLERMHEAAKNRLDLATRAGTAAERDLAQKELLDIELKHQRLCAKYPKWNRPLLTH
jgi:hypothetical protein